MKRVVFFFFVMFFFFLPNFASAQSSYVLPYPAAMPGSGFYKVQQISEKIDTLWHFGNFGQFTYNLKKADKYLVEAKTLFEYKQYLLGYQALEKSNMYFSRIPLYLALAKKEGKDISEKKDILAQAVVKHQEILEKMQYEVPANFIWAAEKSDPVSLDLHKMIKKSIEIRLDSL